MWSQNPERPKYKVLQAALLKETDKETAAAVSSFILSRDDARHLAGHAGFSYVELDEYGRCGVVVYRGIEVSLVFRRQIVEREPWPGEPIPERLLKDPEDAWLQVSLLNTDEVTRQKGLADRLRRTMEEVERLKLMYRDAEFHRNEAEAALARWEEQRKDYAAVKERLALMMLEKEKEKNAAK